MYRESINLLAFITGLLIAFLSGTAKAEPATEATLIQLETTVTQNTSTSIIIGLIVLVALGFIAGQQR